MKKIVIAPDSFKGSLTSFEAVEAISKGIQDIEPNVKLVNFPMSDGGEGFLQCLHLYDRTFVQVDVPVKNLYGKKTVSPILWNEAQKIACIESARILGLNLVKEEDRDPMNASSQGIGELILHCKDLGAEKIIIALGGTGTIDGGIGCLAALGVQFFDALNNKLPPLPASLGKIDSVSFKYVKSDLLRLNLVLAADVTAVLLGSNGAVKGYGPQKGLKSDEIPQLEVGMNHFANHLNAVSGKGIHLIEGTGAAGGLGYSLAACFQATFISGTSLLFKYSQISTAIKEADLVITGEGTFDDQTIQGKLPWKIIQLSNQFNVPVWVFAGTVVEVDRPQDALKKANVYSIRTKHMTKQESMYQAPDLLRQKVAIQLKKNPSLRVNGWKENTEG
ncbi:glycerate kinase [Bacillus sp. 2205SS5-2]|uniref:glycerate kinase n=1 Tax=Bacillus sp. 2205SS5-2 TaxID=3109031 RepID=UPI003006FA9F